MNFKNIMNFDKFLTPLLIKLVYWIGLVVIVISGLGIARGAFSPWGSGFLEIIGGLLMIVLGAIAWRVICEGIIVTFKLFERVSDIRNELTKR